MLDRTKQSILSALLLLVVPLSTAIADDLELSDDLCIQYDTNLPYTPSLAQGPLGEDYSDPYPPAQILPDLPINNGAAVNLMFVLDDSSSMFQPDRLDTELIGQGFKNNWEAVVKHFDSVLNKAKTDNPDTPIKVGITLLRGSEFNRQQSGFGTSEAFHGAYIAYPLTELTTSSLGEMVTVLKRNNGFDPAYTGGISGISDGTPLADALYETALYLRGEAVDLGKSRHDTSIEQVSHPESYSGGGVNKPNCTGSYTDACKDETITGNAIYISPLNSEEDTTNVILFSDGQPTAQTTIDKLKSLINRGTCDTYNQIGPASEPYTACMMKLVQWWKTEDQSSTVNGNQNVTLHTIYYGDDSRSEVFFEKLATPGEGIAVTSKNWSDLQLNFDAVVADILANAPPSLRQGQPADLISYDIQGDATNTLAERAFLYSEYQEVLQGIYTMSELALSPADNNLKRHGTEAYLTVFKPVIGAPWQGNLRKYQFVNTGNGLQLHGKNGPVFDANGNFIPTSQSLWSAAQDGSDALVGGAAGNLPAAGSRKLYTDLTADAEVTATGTAAGSQVTLKDGGNHLNTSNVKSEDLLLPPVIQTTPPTVPTPLTSTEIDEVIKWARGDTPEQANFIGDAIHSSPVVVPYEAGKSLVFFTTNQGYLHAIDSDTGIEDWAYMPKELLGHLPLLSDVRVDDSPTLTYIRHGFTKFGNIYGLDKTPEVLTINKPPYDTIKEADGDRVMIYLSMRRGGDNIYALDVTDPANPILAWKIIGGKSPGFEKLKQTWSKPTHARILVDDAGTEVTRDVLFFGGGYYFWSQDRVDETFKDFLGNSIYMVDAFTGELLWSAGFNPAGSKGKKVLTDMVYSIASDVKIFDANQDGFDDMVVVGDLGGQVWRVDIDNGQPWGTLMDAGRIANFVTTKNENTFRRFFSKPDVLVVKDQSNPNAQPQLAISLGSGARVKPHEYDVEDRFYMIFSNDIYNKPSSYVTLTEANLKDVTSDNSTTTSLSASDQGWFIRLLDDGEKVVTESTTILGTTSFTTYTPPGTMVINGARVADCSRPGITKQYYVRLFNGSGALDTSGNINSATTERFKLVTSTQILPEDGANLVLTNDGAGLYEGVRNVTPSGLIENIRPMQKSGWGKP